LHEGVQDLCTKFCLAINERVMQKMAEKWLETFAGPQQEYEFRGCHLSPIPNYHVHIDMNVLDENEEGEGEGEKKPQQTAATP